MNAGKIKNNKAFLCHDELWPDKLGYNVIYRAMETMDFIDLYDLTGTTGDIGEDNPVKNIIETFTGAIIDSLDWDFNYPVYQDIEKKYDTILCFEVLEHVMNPLLFLYEIKRHIKKKGIIYLSTPYQRPQVLKSMHHYHEIPTDRLQWLFDEAGMNILKKGKATIAGRFIDHIDGVRPFLRYFQKTRLYKLEIK